MTETKSSIAILGAGSIGVAFAILFARQRFAVSVYDPIPEALPRAKADLAERLRQLDDAGQLADGCRQVAERVRFTTDMPDALAAATLVQECAPERVELKQELLRDAGVHTDRDVPLVSSTSAIVPVSYTHLTLPTILRV